MFDKRINIFTGHFGSGKTEVSVNYALKLSEKYKNTCIVDFDIVNPFFRTADARDELERRGVQVMLPRYANTNVDVPALPAEINKLFENKDYHVVFDVGGDDLGARALSRYREEIEQEQHELFFVINTRRPMTNTLEKIIEMLQQIEDSSRLKVTKLVNNTNLLQYTDADEILRGHDIIERVSEKLNIPIAFTSGFENSIELVKDKLKTEILLLDKLIKLPWDINA
jgi:cellulose biosynthesis protein BcsQ